MPDARRRGQGGQYSTHRSTVSNRKYLKSLDPVKRENHRVRTTEYQAIWQLLRRIGCKVDFRMAAPETQRSWLEEAVETLLSKRQQSGKPAGLVDTQQMISRYLDGIYEAEGSQFSVHGAQHHLKGVSLDDRKTMCRLPEPASVRIPTSQPVASFDYSSDLLPSEATSPSASASDNGANVDAVDLLEMVAKPGEVNQKASPSLEDTIQHLQYQVQWLQNHIMDMQWKLAHISPSSHMPGASMQISMNQLTIGSGSDPNTLGLGLGLLSDHAGGNLLDARACFSSEGTFPHK